MGGGPGCGSGRMDVVRLAPGTPSSCQNERVRIAHLSWTRHESGSLETDAPRDPASGPSSSTSCCGGLWQPESGPGAWSPPVTPRWSCARVGLDRDLVPSPAADVAVSQFFLLLSFISATRTCGFSWAVGFRTGMVFTPCTIPRGPEQCRHVWALGTALLDG